MLLIILILVVLLSLRTTKRPAFNVNNINYQKIDMNVAVDPRPQRILVFNSYAYHDKIPEYAKYSIAINDKYTQRFGYTYKRFNHSVETMPPYWMRVKDAYDQLLTNRYDAIMYLDLDAVFYDMDKPIEHIMIGNYDFYIGEDPWSFREELNNLLNTGCFIIRNTEWSKKFLRNWLNACSGDDGDLEGVCKYDWIFKNKNWSCPNCAWAGVKYEQGSLANLYLSNVDNSQKHICIFSKDVLSNNEVSKSSFVLHLMGSSDTERETSFSSIYRKMT